MAFKYSTHQSISSQRKGFTLLELIVVLAGLGILSSLALPNFVALLDSNNVDEIKALLNSAAADCLQKRRSENDPIVDNEIISDDIIRKSGYRINQTLSILDDEGKPKCSQLLLEPINGDNEDLVRYNIGFQLLSNGRLDKIASTEMERKRADCIRWAGKCEISECAKKLEDYKNEVRVARDSCNASLSEWKKTMDPERYQQWDANKGPDGPNTCPLVPPPDLDDDTCDTSYKDSKNCNIDGCNAPIWGLWNDDTNKGTTYSTEAAYELAREKLIGEKCARQIRDEYENANPPFTNPNSNGEPLSECKFDLYWFIDGQSQGTEEKWREGMCEKNKQDISTNPFSGPVEYCDVSPIYIIDGEEINPSGSRQKAEEEFNDRIANDKALTCSNLLRDDAKTKSTPGPHISPTPSDMKPIIPGDCAAEYWYCKETGKIYRSEEEFNRDASDSCKTPACEIPPVDCNKKKNRKDPRCVIYRENGCA